MKNLVLMPAYASGFIIEGMINTASFIVRDCFVLPYFDRLSTSPRNDPSSEEDPRPVFHRKHGHGEFGTLLLLWEWEL